MDAQAKVALLEHYNALGNLEQFRGALSYNLEAGGAIGEIDNSRPAQTAIQWWGS